MRLRPYKFMTVFLAMLLAVSSLTPIMGRAEAQMRCAGASPRSAPCARAELPTAGLTEKQVYHKLMACCQSMRSGCTMMRDCPMRHRVASQPPHRSDLFSRRCLVSIRVSSVPTVLAAPRARWLLAAAPALAPPMTSLAIAPVTMTACVAAWTYTPVLSPHTVPALHGLRAPPAA